MGGRLAAGAPADERFKGLIHIGPGNAQIERNGVTR
jgi:hypothetical protein